MNRHALQVLELPAVLELVARRAGSELGRAAIRSLAPSTDRSAVERELGRVDAVVSLLERTDGWALPPVPDVRPELKRLAKAGSYLEAPALLAVATLLRSSATTREALAPHAGQLEPLGPILDRLLALDDEIEAIDGAIDEAGEVRDSASRELERIRRELRTRRSTIVERLERYVGGLPDGYRVEDASVTVREGRYVVPIRREGRKHVGGIVHDESASGATLFVEPPLALELMNRVRELEMEETREVRRILEALAAELRPHVPGIRGALDALVELDSLYGRARYAREHGSVAPALVDGAGDYEVVAGHHPLLLEGDQDVVPFDLELGPDERTLVVSGPNTGGKTVLLKSIGLISAMTQAGVVPPVADGTRLPVFGDIFADIGDEQSIEASLSTFSAHLANLKEIVEEAGPDALALIDEIGSGTDPSEGGSLARAILVELTRRGTRTIASSHLGQLKLLAGEEPGVVNASLQFDPDALRPTYRLLKGIPGRSYGLAIARRLGFREDVLDRAEADLPTGERDVGRLIAELEDKERELAEAVSEAARERAAAESAREEADGLRSELNERTRELRRREEDAERRARQQARDLLLDARREVEEAVAELRAVVERGGDAAAFEEAATAARRRVERAATRQAERTPEPADEPPRAPELEAGVSVRVASTGARGRVVEVRDDRATVEVKGLRLDVKASELERVAGGEEADGGSSTARRWSGPRVDAPSEVHLRGLRAEEVAGTLHPALDAAIQAGLPSLTVIHGKGEGVLREVVAELLDEDPRISAYRPGRIGEGGTGVTVVELG